MIKVLIYLQSVYRNRSSRLKGELLKLYLVLHGCKIGKGLKCATFPYFKGFPNKNITIGNNVDLGRNLTIELSEKGKLLIEDYVLLHQNILLSCNTGITIRKWAAIAENVSIRDGNHLFKADKYYRLQDTISKPIEIGEGSGVAASSIILMGATVAKGSFIGAHSIVTHKTIIEENSIYAGNPLKLIYKRS